MSPPHVKRGPPGVLVFGGVRVVDASAQQASAYLHVTGGSRDVRSHRIEVFLNATGVSSSDHGHPAFAGEFTAYNSPAPHGPGLSAHPNAPLAGDQGAPQIMVDISEAFERLGDKPGPVDVTLLFLTFSGAPMDVATMAFDDVWISRRPLQQSQ